MTPTPPPAPGAPGREGRELAPRPYFHRGMTVRTWYDTGAFGSNLLYGRVVAAGERSFVVEWESGIRNRLPQGYRGIEVVYGPERPS